MVPLPIDIVVPQVLAELRAHRSLVLVAEPGAGKTTRVPPAIVKQKLLSDEHPNVVLLQPRRVAARAAASRIAEENGWQLGREVGYQIRFERRISADTRLHVMTEGVLARQLLDDPILEGVGCVILDEFHERSLHTDLAVALLREVQQTVRPDLHLVVMSATLEAEPVSRFLGDCPIVRSVGRTYPVSVEHAGAVHRLDLPARVAAIVAEPAGGESGGAAGAAGAADDGAGDSGAGDGGAGEGGAGDVLVFMPGVGEINRTMDALEPLARRDGLLVLPLHGQLASDEQFAALRPARGRRRKVVVATNIAETSLTIDGVRTVIDSGLARVAGFDAQRGMDRLELKRISRASATQRAGRAGRTAPGRCVRLWSAVEDKNLDAFETPEVRRVDLTQTVLALHAWGHPDPRKFGWYDPPDERALVAAERLLEMLGAVTAEAGGKITALGRQLLALPAHPRLGRLLVAAAELGLVREGASVAALLSEKDILRPRTDLHPSERHARVQTDSDLLERLDLLESRRRDADVDQAALRQVMQARDELERTARRISDRGTGASPVHPRRPAASSASGSQTDGEASSSSAAPRARSGGTPKPREEAAAAHYGDDALLRLPLWAYPDRVCRRRSIDPSAGVMVGGSGVRLAPESGVRTADFFLALDPRQDERNPSREAVVRIASKVQVEWLEAMFPQEIRRRTEAVYDEGRDRVVGVETVLYRDLALREHSDAAVDAATAERVLAEWATPRAWDLLRRDERAERWLARLALLGKAMPDKGWPAIGDATAREVVSGAVGGKRSVSQLAPALLPALQGLLQYPLDRLMEAEAPESIEVPTGNRIKLDYPPQNDVIAQPPVLAVRLQELFGMIETPRVAGGRVPVRLHLLGPNYRPVQITDDLRSFWSTTYFQVRKDLRVRYPKHAWPEDPLSAKPEAKGSRRRS